MILRDLLTLGTGLGLSLSALVVALLSVTGGSAFAGLLVLIVGAFGVALLLMRRIDRRAIR